MNNAEDEDEDESDDGRDQDPKEKISQDQLTTILQGTKSLAYVPWPSDPSLLVGMRPLSREEVLQGAAAAKRYTDSLGLTDIVVETVEENGRKHTLTWLHLAQRDEWLSVALRRPEGNGKRPLFASAGDLRSKLTTEEVDRLYDMLAEHMSKCMPLTLAEQLGEREEWLAIINDLKKKPEQTTLVGVRPDILRELIYFLISQLPDSLLSKSITSTSSE